MHIKSGGIDEPGDGKKACIANETPNGCAASEVKVPILDIDFDANGMRGCADTGAKTNKQ